MNVNIYKDVAPIIDIESMMYQFFGTPSSDAVVDLAILFSAIIFVIFCYCIVLVLFKK